MQKIINPSPNTATTSAYPMATVIVSGAVFTFPIVHVKSESSCIQMHYTLLNNAPVSKTTASSKSDKAVAKPTTNPSKKKTPSMLSIVASDRVVVNLRFTTGSDFFVNSYTVFKTALELLTYYQQQNSNEYTELNDTEKYFYGGETVKDGATNAMKFISYFGRNEYLVYGQIESIEFSNSSDTNMYEVQIVMQRRDFYNDGFRAESGMYLELPKVKS